MARAPKTVDERLARYREMRTPGATPEPMGGAARSESKANTGIFCVQQHAATRLHYDLRLEIEGTLVSWAVPKGPSFDPDEKRLATQTEDHPLEYANFEGIIPEGNYGAGAMILWDRGEFVPLENPVAGLEKGALKFELRGTKLHGEWTLARTSRGPNEWLLIKRRDGWADKNRVAPPESVLSNLTLEELKAGRGPMEALREELARLKAPAKRVDVATLKPMLAEVREEAFTDPAWIFELKYDGYRLFASREGKRVRLQLRGGTDASHVFPEIAEAIARLPVDDVILDGEAVAFDEKGRTDFQRLQQRGQLRKPLDVKHALASTPVTFVAFDLVTLDGHDLRALPLLERKALLKRLIPKVGALRYADHIEEQGEAMYAEIDRLELEGLIAKKADSRYVSTRSPSWLKVVRELRGDFAIVGFTQPKGARTGFGALQVAVREGDGFVYAGGVGTGFDDRQLTTFRARLEPDRRDDPPCGGVIPKDQSIVWVEPKYVCEVRYKEWSRDRQLRHPVFLRWRDDKRPDECTAEGRTDAGLELGGDQPPSPQPATGTKAHSPKKAESQPVPPPGEPDRNFNLSNLSKVFWPDDGITKGDLIEYYEEISPWMLPYLKDRPVTLTRYPDGIAGKSFFQKDTPAHVPSWLRRERVWSEDAQREIDHFVCEDLDSLLYLVNMGTIPFHLWSARTESMEQPDWTIVDLDPKGAAFENVVKIALRLHALCDEIGLPNFVKTSGSSGLHVLVPLGRQLNHAQATSFAELLARVVSQELPDIATIIRLPANRGGRVYLDYLQNGRGKLLAAPFCVRPLRGAPVSMPLDWSEVTPKLRIAQFHLRNAPDRMKQLGRDPFAPVLELAPDLASALGRLATKLKAGS